MYASPRFTVPSFRLMQGKIGKHYQTAEILLWTSVPSLAASGLGSRAHGCNSASKLYYPCGADHCRNDEDMLPLLSCALEINTLTHWGRVTHICVSKLTIIGSDNGLSPDRRQAIIWTNAGILLIRPSGTNFNEMLIEILTVSFMKMRLKVLSAKWRPFCLGINVLRYLELIWYSQFITYVVILWYKLINNHMDYSCSITRTLIARFMGANMGPI